MPGEAAVLPGALCFDTYVLRETGTVTTLLGAVLQIYPNCSGSYASGVLGGAKRRSLRAELRATATTTPGAKTTVEFPPGTAVRDVEGFFARSGLTHGGCLAGWRLGRNDD